MSTATTAELAAMTPAEVDTLAAPLEHALGDLVARQWYHESEARKARRTGGRFGTERAERHDRDAEALTPQIDAARTAVAPYRAEYARRPWPRLFWCTANGGHAHRSTACSTLRPTTGMVWLPEHSGKHEEELVGLAGSAACTICFPSAPTDVLARPSQLRPAVEEREAKEARAREAAERKAAKAAKGIADPNTGGQLRVDGYVISSEVTARNEYVKNAAEAADHAEGLTTWGDRPDLAERYGARAAQLLAALAYKHGRTVEEEAAELAPKVEARRKKDARERAKWGGR